MTGFYSTENIPLRSLATKRSCTKLTAQKWPQMHTIPCYYKINFSVERLTSPQRFI